MGLSKNSPLRLLGTPIQIRRKMDKIAIDFVNDDRNVFFTARQIVKWCYVKNLLPFPILYESELRKSYVRVFSGCLKRIEKEGLIEKRDITNKRAIKWKRVK